MSDVTPENIYYCSPKGKSLGDEVHNDDERKDLFLFVKQVACRFFPGEKNQRSDLSWSVFCSRWKFNSQLTDLLRRFNSQVALVDF